VCDTNGRQIRRGDRESLAVIRAWRAARLPAA